MSRHYVSSAAECPFYRGEDAKTIYCDGIEPDAAIALAFGNRADDYKEAFCRSNWRLCKVAKMLWDSEN